MVELIEGYEARMFRHARVGVLYGAGHVLRSGRGRAYGPKSRPHNLEPESLIDCVFGWTSHARRLTRHAMDPLEARNNP